MFTSVVVVVFGIGAGLFFTPLVTGLGINVVCDDEEEEGEEKSPRVKGPLRHDAKSFLLPRSHKFIASMITSEDSLLRLLYANSETIQRLSVWCFLVRVIQEGMSMSATLQVCWVTVVREHGRRCMYASQSLDAFT